MLVASKQNKFDIGRAIYACLVELEGHGHFFVWRRVIFHIMIPLFQITFVLCSVWPFNVSFVESCVWSVTKPILVDIVNQHSKVPAILPAVSPVNSGRVPLSNFVVSCFAKRNKSEWVGLWPLKSTDLFLTD